MRVAITGGAGFIGYHLARHHLTRSDTVVLLDNLSKADGIQDAAFQQLVAQPAVQFLPVDLTVPVSSAVAAEFPDVDIVYHLAAINGTQLFYDTPYSVSRTNVLSTVHLLDLLRDRRIGRLVYSSSSEVYADAARIGALTIPTDETVPVVFAQPTHMRFSYGSSKFMGEVLCAAHSRQYGMPTTIVRYHNVYGPRMGQRHVIPEFIERIRRKDRPFSIFGGHETRAFCYVGDAVEATYRVATTPACAGEIIHIGNAREEVHIRKVARLLMELSGYEAPLLERGSREASVARRCPNTAKLKMLTGFEASTGLREGLQRTLEWQLAAAEASQ